MFNKFIKKSSKFFAVLLTATLAFTPLSYAEPMTFADLYGAISSDGTVSPIEIPNNIEAATADTTLGEQALDSLTINGADYTVSGANSAYGMKIDAGSSGPLQEKITEINNIEFKNFYKDDDGSVIYNKAGSLTIKNSSFTANKGTGRGGAIYHKTKSDEQPEEHRYGSLTIQNSLFSGNEAFAMGAIHSEGKLTITDTVFENNKAEYMGVLGVTGSKKDKTTLTNVTFSNNSSTNNSGAFPNSGVIYLGGEANISIAGSTFENNTSAAEAGAIGSAFLDLGGEDPDFKNAKLDVTGSTFKKNTAQTNGGAIDNYFYGSEAYPTTNNETFEPGYVYVKDTTFEENKAKNGGAVYNHGNIDGKSVAQMVIDGATKFIKNIAGISSAVTGNGGAILNEGNLIINDGVEFSTNSASGKGGAIFNTSSGSEGGVIDFNGSATFVDNYTGSEDNKNDIYNDGTLNFNGNADGATVTMTGGIVGSGDTNIGDAYNTNNTVSVKLGSDAKLEQNIIYINQNSSLEGNAANIKATFGGETPAMYNEGSLVLFTNSADAVSFANNVYDPTRTGTTTVKTGANIDMSKHTLQQYGLTLEEDATLTVDANILELGESGSGVVTNNGNLIFKSAMATTPMSNINDISGTGKLTINGKVTNTENFSISQDNGIEIVEDGEFTAFADDIKAAVTNSGTYNVTGGTISYKVTGGNININTAEVKISSTIYKSNINISTSVIVDKESYLGDSSETASDLTINTGAKIDMKNDTVGTATINSITVNPSTEWTLLIDADLAAKTADNFVILDTENSSIGADSQATIDTVNFLSDFEEGQVDAKMQVANANINLQLADPLNILKLYTTENSYNISTINDETGSFLNVVLSGLGTLPQAIYDGADEYSATRDEEITAWIDDVNTLSANLFIIGNDKTIKAAETGVLEGINTSTYTLTIEDLAGFEGFNNAVTVSSTSEYTGFLNVSTVTFKNNTGDAVIRNDGYLALKNVTFEGNTASTDVKNDGDLIITGAAGVTSVEKGITGTGTATIAEGATLEFKEGTGARLQQTQISNNAGTISFVNGTESAVVTKGTITADDDYQNDITNNKIVIGNADENKAGFVQFGNGSYSDTIEYQNIEVSSGTLNLRTDAYGTYYESEIKNSAIKVGEHGTLIANADSIKNLRNADGSSEDIAIINDGTLEFYGGINNNNITSEDKGNLIISADGVTNNAAIQQSTITVASGANFINGEDATITTNALAGENGTVTNNGKLFLNLDSSEGFGIKDLTAYGSDSPKGETTITTNTTGIEIDLTGRTLKQGVLNFEGTGTVSLTADPEGEDYNLYTNIVNYLQTEDGTDGLNLHIDVYPSLNNKGVVNIYEDGGVVSIVNSTGTVNVLGGTHDITIRTDNEEDITKNVVNIGDAEHFAGLALSGGIYSQTITISSGSITLMSGREGGATIRNSSMTITEGGNLISWSADAISTVDNEIRSDGTITFKDGVNINDIIGAGTLVIDGEVTNGTPEGETVSIAPTILQSTVSISGTFTNSSGTITTSYLTGEGSLVNNDKLVLNVNDEKAFGITSLTGVGVSSITVTADAQDETTIGIFGATIQQDKLEFYGDKTLRIDGSTSTRAVAPITTIGADIYNYMTGDSLHLTSVRLEGDFVNNTDAVAYFEENSSVSGQIINNGGTLNIVSSGFVVENGITSDNQAVDENILNIGDAENAAVVNSSTTISYQTITVSSGSLTMNSADADGSITNSSITVKADGLLSVNPEKLEDITNPITNDGIVEYYGGGEGTDYVLNTTTITASNEGILRIKGNVQNDEAIGISKQNIEVLQTSTFTVNTNDMTDSKIENAGEVILFGLSPMTNETEITGLTDDEGNTTYGNLSIDTELVNNAEIEQTDIITGTYLTNNAEITAHGTIYNYLEIDNNSTINAATFRNEDNATTTNESGATITATTRLFNMGNIDNTGNIAAENEAGDALLENAEDATIINKQEASISADSLANSGTIQSSGTITATDITNEAGGVIENYKTNEGEDAYEGGMITSANMAINKGTITSYANGFDAEVQNTDGGVYNILGGTVTKSITGSNGGTVNINKSSVTVVEDAYISQNTINLEGTQLKLEDESNLRTSVLNIGEGSTLDINNGETNDMNIEEINVAQGITWNFNFDVDLQAQTSDLLTNTTFGDGSTMNIGIINILADTDRATPTNLEIADSFSNTNIEYATFATTQLTYSVKQLTGGDYDNATWLSIQADGYGGLPVAVYDGLPLYLVTGDEEGNDYVTEWINDDGVQDTLKADLAINALDSGKVLLSTNSLTGLKTDKYTLKINNQAESQELTVKGFENALTVDNADGKLEVNKVVFSSNTGTAVITNNGTTVLNGVTFDDTNTADADVANNGDLLLSQSSSTFTKGIVGQGTTTIKGVGIDMGDATLQQSRVEISDVEGSSLTVRVANSEVGLFMNNGELSLIGGEADAVELSSEINGIGDTTLSDMINVANNISQENIIISENAQITVNDTASIKASTITVNADATLTANAGNIITTTDGKIANEGEITFTGGTNNNIITGDQGKIFIDMNAEVINSTGTKITQQFIEVREDGKFTMNADDVETATDDASGTNIFGIQNNGDLEITGGTNKNIIGRGDGVTGNVIISGNVINEENTEIEQEAITVNAGAQFTASASDLVTDNGIGNAGELIFTGSDMENNNEIIGEGNLTVIGDLQNNKSITQTKIDVVSGTFEHNAGDDDTMAAITAANVSVSTSAIFIAHSEITVSDQITNDGTFKINVLKPEGGADNVESQNNIIGKGSLIISSTVYTNDGGTISQKTITIEDEDSGFTSDIQKVTTTDGIANSGEVTFTGNGINKNVISGTGNLTIDGTIENSTGTAISQTAIAVTSGNGFKTSANDVTTTDGIENDGTLTFTGGTNTNEITMLPDAEGVLVVEGDLTNQANIEQKEINITGGDFENVRASSITANSITVADGSALITDAKDLAVSDGITITGEETLLNLKDEGEAEIGAAITGAGKIVKEGEGTVTLSGENGYSGTTTITGGAIKIVAANGISENTLYMDGGKLITGENSEIALSNEIIGTDHNDVNIETEEGGNLILDGEIFGNKDLVKTGTGLLDLQMESNSYAGDTIISSGTVRGTTANINGKVTGSGAEDSAVEFYDADGEVTLNEIADMGTFDKTGAATMTVTNNFKAINANILSGTFIIDNDTEMGGSGSTFEVTGDMRVENTLLKGYGDITTGNLIIGQGATFAPGNSTTTFKVTGDLTFEEDGNYDVEFGQVSMDEAGHYNDNTTVSGTTTIGDNAKITLNNLEGKYYVPETIELINSGTLADGYEYQEDNVTFNDNDANDLRPGYDTRISTRVYTEGNVLKIDLQRNQSEYSDAIEFERSHNEQEAANAIDAISTGNGGDITNPLDAMEKMYYYQETYDIDGLKAALNDIAGVIHANSTMLTFTNAKIEHVYDKVQERSKCLLPCDKVHDKIWAEYYYNTYSVDANENSPKFDTNVNGFLVGFDMISAKNLTLGIMAGYGTSELKQVKDKTTMNDINFGFYGGYETEKWLFKGMLLGGYEQYSTDRTIGFMDRMANSEYNGYSAALDLELGYKISLNKKDSQAKHKMYLKPYLGVTGSYIMNEGFEEKNAESLNLKVEDYNAMTAQARAGIGINGKVKKFGWYAKAGVRHYLTEDYNEIESSLLDYKDQTAMKIRSAEMGKLSYGGGLGADYELSKAWTVFANGLASFADNSTNYYGNIGLMYKFGCVNNEKKTDEDVEKISAVLNDKITEDEMLKRDLKNKEKELAQKEKELADAKAREKELQDRIQKYEANIVSAEQAQQMKEKTIKTYRLGEKPTFVFGTDKLNKSGKASLKQVATELEGYPDAEVLVEGHTDNVGGDEINQKISEQRASSVATTLKKDYGVKNNISVIGKGKTEPIASNDTAEGRAKNRRVEVILTTAE